MSKFPTLIQVANILAEGGHSGCALAVNRARHRINELEHANQKILEAFQDLQRKYEPRPTTPNDPIYTGD
jgi:hypothetical protein